MESPFKESASIWGPKPPKECNKCKGQGIVHLPNPSEHLEDEHDYCPECDGDGAFPVEQ